MCGWGYNPVSSKSTLPCPHELVIVFQGDQGGTTILVA